MYTDWIVTYVTRHPMLKVESVYDLVVRAKSDADAIAHVERVIPLRSECALVGKPTARKYI